MNRISEKTFRKAGAALCAVLMLVFALASAANAVNRIQHATGQLLPHQHTMFSKVQVDDHHAAAYDHYDDHHHDHIAANADQSGHLDDLETSESRADAADILNNTHHHHHGDAGGSVIILGSAEAVLSTPPEQRQGSIRSCFSIIVRQTLPERPPRATHIAV